MARGIYERTPEIREKMRKAAIVAHRRDPSLRFREPLTGQARKEISQTLKKGYASGRIVNASPNAGKKFSRAWRTSLSRAHNGLPATKGFLGRKHSAATKAKMSKAQKGVPSPLRGRKHPEGCSHCAAVVAYMQKSPQPETKLERILYRFLCCAAFKVERQKRFGKYIVDAYVPEYHLAFEADGATWHSYPEQVKRDAIRDKWLQERFGLPVVRMPERELLKLAGSSAKEV